MKLTEELKKKIEQAKSKDEAISLIEEAGVELTDEELAMLSGGEDTNTLEQGAPGSVDPSDALKELLWIMENF